MMHVKCHLCGRIIGRFGPIGDHGAMEVECPHCEEVVTIHTATMADPDFHEKDGTVKTSPQ